MRRRAAVLVLTVLFGWIAAAQDIPELTVDASQSHGIISPYVYGSNMNLYTIIPMDLMDEAQQLGLKYVRFGGGDSDIQDLRESIIDLFVLQTRAIGAEPALTVRLLGGTPQKAAEIVHYANVEKDYGIRYWSIGNEPNLFVALMGVPRYTVDDLNREWRAIAEAMLAVDPDIRFVGPDITQYALLNSDLENLQYVDRGSSLDAEGRDWMVEFLRANGDLLSYVSIHRYPWPGLGREGATIDGLRRNSREWDGIVDNLRIVVQEVTGRDIPIAVTELNSNSANSVGGAASLDSHANAIWLGDVLGRLIRQKTAIAAYWDIQGGSNRGWGILGRTDLRPTAHTYRMYSHFGAELVASGPSDDPSVSIYAALRADGVLTLVVINLSESEQARSLSLAGFVPAGDAEVWRFDAAHPVEMIAPQRIEDDTILTVPPLSMTLYAIPPKR